MSLGNFSLTNRDYAVLLLEDVDLEAQLLAVRSILTRNAQADAELAEEIEGLGRRAGEASGEYGQHLENTWVDHLHGSVFQDAAHSMAAVGMLAPTVESLFVATFRAIGGLAPPVTPVTPVGVRANHVGDSDFWDPHFVFGPTRKQKTAIVRGIRQLAESTGLAAHLPADYADVLNALFAYRNKMFHLGFEWPKEERQKFEARIVAEGWPGGWFSRSLSKGETWILYMSDALVQLVLTRIDEMLDGIGVFIQARYP